MFPVNHIYGQDLILALHTGVAGRPAIWGHMQHAWRPDLPFWEGETLRPWWPVFVFSEANRRAAEEFLGGQGPNIVPIGSPFLYLLDLLRSQGSEEANQPGQGRTIFYPYHYFGDEETVPAHHQLAAWIREREGAGTTVCLHWHDHENPRIVAAHRAAELRVITHGYGGDPLFLLRQHAEMLRHGRVLANRVSTPSWHAAALGCHVEVAGPIFDHIGQVMSEEETPEAVEAMERARWPQLFDGGTHGDELVALADIELGRQHLRSPDQLRRLLGWNLAGRARTAVAGPGLRTYRRLRKRPA